MKTAIAEGTSPDNKHIQSATPRWEKFRTDLCRATKENQRCIAPCIEAAMPKIMMAMPEILFRMRSCLRRNQFLHLLIMAVRKSHQELVPKSTPRIITEESSGEEDSTPTNVIMPSMKRNAPGFVTVMRFAEK